MKKLLLHHAYNGHDPYFVYHCRMIAWIVNNEKKLTYEAYHSEAVRLGIISVGETMFNSAMGITSGKPVEEVTL